MIAPVTERPFQGILFDFDGTLARTMEDNLEAWRAVTRPHGIELSPDDYFPYEGLPMAEIAARFFGARKLTVPDVPALLKSKDEWYLAHHRFALYPGVEEFVDRCAHLQIRMGIVTAGLRDRIVSPVPKGFLEKFTALVTGDMTSRGKPHPDPYLRGAQELGLPPDACIVVENAPLGIQAAKSAAAYCVAVCSTLARGYLSEADAIVERFEDMSALPAIRRLLAAGAEVNR
ncbi:MAG: HAD family phosphatase [Acidobacteria bacterium]|nr:HAD family phosphatase [Acidobacteriota bacterium]